MTLLAITVTIAAFFWTLATLFANGMRSSPGAFRGRGTIIGAWLLAAFFWFAWWFS